MFVQHYFVAPSRNHCCYATATMVPVFIIVGVDVDVNNIKMFSVALVM
jgi:hypothetical protein